MSIRRYGSCSESVSQSSVDLSLRLIQIFAKPALIVLPGCSIMEFFFPWQNDMEAAREAYDAFLSHYPYCYGYWRKYADYEKRKGNKKKCEEVGIILK